MSGKAGQPLYIPGPDNRAISVRLTEAHYNSVMDHATRRGMSLATHVRDVLIRAAQGEIKVDSQAQLPLI